MVFRFGRVFVFYMLREWGVFFIREGFFCFFWILWVLWVFNVMLERKIWVLVLRGVGVSGFNKGRGIVVVLGVFFIW